MKLDTHIYDTKFQYFNHNKSSKNTILTKPFLMLQDHQDFYQDDTLRQAVKMKKISLSKCSIKLFKTLLKVSDYTHKVQKTTHFSVCFFNIIRSCCFGQTQGQIKGITRSASVKNIYINASISDIKIITAYIYIYI